MQNERVFALTTKAGCWLRSLLRFNLAEIKKNVVISLFKGIVEMDIIKMMNSWYYVWQ